MPQAITDVGQAVLVSLTAALTSFMAFLPAFIGAILVLILGWIVASVIAGLIERGLVAVGFEKAMQRSGLADSIGQMRTRWTASKLVAQLAKWFIFLIFVQAAANVLGMPQVTAIINSIVLFIPNVVVALLILVVGAFIARVLSDLVRGSLNEMGVGNPDLLAGIAQYAVVGFAVVAAVNQLGIAETVVNTLFIGLVGSIALALGLAFGLGGRDVAAQITRTWYERGRTASEQIAAKAETARPGETTPMYTSRTPEERRETSRQPGD